MGLQVVWFKRDLRIADHGPLTEAAAAGPCLFIYVYEPEILAAEHFDQAHFRCLSACLQDLHLALQSRGNSLQVLRGTMPEVLDRLYEAQPFERLWSHEETGPWDTYMRDERVRAWCRRRGVAWIERPQHGVIRRLKDRDGWSRAWYQRMKAPQALAPERIAPWPKHRGERWPDIPSAALRASTIEDIPVAGRTAARETLDSFLGDRGVNYRKDMSSPVTAWSGCSRLSPYLAYGVVSIREVFQALEARRQDVREAKKRGEEIDTRWAASLSSFGGRLRWHCHFMQKLEDEPRIEFENMARAYDGMREDEWNEDYYEAWRQGQTGYPMVDACMRALCRHGWINFRMRAMLVSFSSYHLWLHWRQPALWLARHFLDFEAGIHFSQVQMQSATTGINTVRIYSPAKQTLDQDPEGVFIRRYVPELEGVPIQYLAEPHKMSPAQQAQYGCRIGKDYPAPLVDHGTAYREARRRVYAFRSKREAREESKQVYARHGSRRRPGGKSS